MSLDGAARRRGPARGREYVLIENSADSGSGGQRRENRNHGSVAIAEEEPKLEPGRRSLPGCPWRAANKSSHPHRAGGRMPVTTTAPRRRSGTTTWVHAGRETPFRILPFHPPFSIRPMAPLDEVSSDAEPWLAGRPSPCDETRSFPCTRNIVKTPRPRTIIDLHFRRAWRSPMCKERAIPH